MDWKTDLGNFLGEKHIYRQKVLDLKLKVYCSEWCSYIKEFDNIQTDLGIDYLKSDVSGMRNKLLTEAYNVVIFPQNFYPFKVSLYFKSPLEMVVHFPKELNKQSIKKGLLDQNEIFGLLQKEYEPLMYNWTTELLHGEEIHEKEYIFQILNNRFKAWMDRQKELI